MPQVTLTGDSVQEINEISHELRRSEELVDSGLLDVFEKIVEVRDELQAQTESGSVRRNEIEDELGKNVYQELQLLQSHGIAASGGQGGNWRYTGE